MTLALVERGAAGPAERLLVLLPGFGDEPDLFADHLDAIDPLRRWHVAVARPPVVTDEGPAWFTVGDDGPEPAQLAAGIEALGSTLTDLTTRLAVGADALVLGGYSQGGAMALAALLDPTLSVRPTGVAALAAYLPHREAAQDRALAEGHPLLIAHGADDDVVDPLLGRSAAKALHRAGAVVTWAEVDGDHRLGAPLLDELRGWLDAVADGDTPSAPAA